MFTKSRHSLTTFRAHRIVWTRTATASTSAAWTWKPLGNKTTAIAVDIAEAAVGMEDIIVDEAVTAMEEAAAPPRQAAQKDSAGRPSNNNMAHPRVKDRTASRLAEGPMTKDSVEDTGYIIALKCLIHALSAFC